MVAAESLIASAILKILSSQLEQFVVEEYDKFKNADITFLNLGKSLAEAKRQLRLTDNSPDNIFTQLQMDTMYRLCYDADDLKNDIVSQIKEKNQISASLHRKPVLNLAKSLKNIKLSRKIHELLKDLDAMKKNLETHQDSNDKDEVTSLRVPRAYDRLESMGREEKAKVIITELTSQQNLHGVSIVGIRGIGKRALADYILYSNEVRAKFPLILKASMSGNSFNKYDLQVETLPDSRMKSPLLSNEKSLDLLHNQEWLLWMDELSYVEIMNWNEFRETYPANGNRKFLITTLNPDVGKTTHTNPHYLKALSDNCCQKLISEALQDCSVSQNTIKNMAKQCYGLPSIAIVFARALAKRGGGNQRLELRHLPEFQKDLFPHLTSSYTSLDSHIVKCFTYLSLFPLDYKFDEEELTLLWVGEGLMEDRDSNTKEYWRNCFNDLLNNSILQPVSARDSATLRYEMHKFTHSFVQLTAPKIYLRFTDQSSDIFDNVNTCHLSVSHDIQEHVWKGIRKLKCLRTLLSLYDGKPGQLSKMPRDLFTWLPRLRVLVLKNTNIDKLPNFIKNLKFLRHLDISETLVKRVDDDLCTLKNLKVFKFKKAKTQSGNCTLQLPKKFSDLTNLVFLDWGESDIKSLASMPRYIGKLINLQTLPFFAVGEKEGYRIEELEKMKHLQKSIRITSLENVQDEDEAKRAKISDKLSLERLQLEWTKLKNDRNEYKVLRGLEPCDSLKELHITNYGFSEFPEWFCQSSLGLEKVQLNGCNTLPTLGQIPELKTIHLEKMNTLTSIENLYCRSPKNCSGVCFKNLESLVLSDMEVLQDLTDLGTNNMPKFSKLEIEKCPKLKTLPSLIRLTSLKDIKIQDCKALSSQLVLPQSLKTLTINRSALLAGICQGHDWLSKISNELKVYIDGILFVKPTLASATALSNPPQKVSPWLYEYLDSLPDKYKYLQIVRDCEK